MKLKHPRCAFGTSSSRGRHQRPGKAGSAVSQAWSRARELLCSSTTLTTRH